MSCSWLPTEPHSVTGMHQGFILYKVSQEPYFS